MDLKIDSRNVGMTPNWKTEIEERMAALQTEESNITHARVTLTKNAHHKKGSHHAEALIVLTLPPRHTITARKDAKSFEEAIRAAFSAAEIEILESLVARREELEARARELDMREKLLATAELRIDGKIAELKKIEASIAGSIEQFDEREEAKITSLVKIYEKMKAKDAARIFNQLDGSLLLSVVQRMREAKAAEIISQMSGDKARVVTMSLARQRSLPIAGAKQASGM